ncbi:MAG: hypothetical protein GY702_28015 [Desulfobulbaceae bacterium]|nr:hypothetical protein [Desulfobulbaceae bacterium]
MVKGKDAVIGYFAIHPPQDVLCDGDACIIAGSQSALNRYINSLSYSGVEFQKRKTRFSEIQDGLFRGGAYAFDKESYKAFYPLANKHGYHLEHEEFPETETGRHFVIVKHTIS